LLEAAGAKASGSVSAKTDYLIAVTPQARSACGITPMLCSWAARMREQPFGWTIVLTEDLKSREGGG
jgi:hypothetical protein